MLKSLLCVASALALLSGNATADPRIQPNTPINPGPRLPPGTVQTLIPTACVVDPAIVSLTLTKGARPGQVRISYEIANRGTNAWVSGDNQQLVSLTARNANTRHVFTDHRALTGRAAAGARMLHFDSPMIDNAFDSFEFAGEVDLMITYDPDILIDAQPCNNDANTGNNRLRVENTAILGFMRGSVRSQTFRP